MAFPRGTNISSFDAEGHNGGGVSGFTAWSMSRSVANFHANKSGIGGVVLKKQFRASDTFPSPDIFHELEVLVPGIVVGASVSKPNTPGTPTAY